MASAMAAAAAAVVDVSYRRVGRANGILCRCTAADVSYDEVLLCTGCVTAS